MPSVETRLIVFRYSVVSRCPRRGFDRMAKCTRQTARLRLFPRLVHVADYRMIPRFSRTGDVDRAPPMHHLTRMPEIASCPA